MKKAPLDILSIKTIGAKKWQEDFFLPLSDSDFFQMSQDVEKLYCDQIDHSEKKLGDAWLLCRDIPLNLSFGLNGMLLRERYAAQGNEVLAHEENLWGRGALFSQKGLFASKPKMLPPPKLRTRMRLFLRDLSSCFKKGKGRTLVCGDGEFLDNYCKEKGGACQYLTVNYLANKNNYSLEPEPPQEAIVKSCDLFLEGFFQLLPSLERDIIEREREKLKDYLILKISNAQRLISCVSKVLEAKNYDTLLLTGLGNPIRKAAAIASRNQGKKVVSFLHGGNPGTYDTIAFTLSEFALSDEFVTYTQEAIPLMETIRDNHPIPRQQKPKIVSTRIQKYQRAFENEESQETGEIRRVMLLGFPHNFYRKYHVFGAYSLLQLDLEMKVYNALESMGYEVIYKAHPERYEEVKGIFPKATKTSFEKIKDQGDAYLFCNIRTSAFAEALCSQKPIFAFRIKGEPYSMLKEAKLLLEQRCSFIDLDYDKKNRLIFSEEELRKVVSNPLASLDHSYIEKYLF